MGLAAVCGERLLGRSTARPAAVAYRTAIVAVLAATAPIYLRYGHRPLTGLVAASVNRARLRPAIPAVPPSSCARPGRPDIARIASLTVAGAWFVLLRP